MAEGPTTDLTVEFRQTVCRWRDETLREQERLLDGTDKQKPSQRRRPRLWGRRRCALPEQPAAAPFREGDTR